MTIANRIVLAALLGGFAAEPLSAQRGRGRPPVDTTQRPDTNALRRAANGSAYALDYQQQELRVVLSAVAEAGGLNVTLTNIPSKRIDLRMGVPATKEAMLDVLRGLAASNDLRIIETPSLIRVEGQPQVTPAQQFQQAVQQQQLRLYTYRLKHASAVQLAPVLMQLFTGGVGGAGRGTQIIPNANGGFQILNPNGGGGNVNVGGAGRGAAGRGGVQAPAAPGQNPVQQALQGLQQAFQQGGNGALSSASADIRIIAEESTNSLMVRATADDWALIQQIVQSVDLRPLQVLIEVTIAEVQRTHDYDVGISGTATKKAGADTVGLFPTAASARDFIATLTGGKGAVNYNVALSALQTRGDVRILSLPMIIAQNNRQAILNVGQRVPFVQISQTGALTDPSARVETIQYQDVGTKLTITPTINQDGYVNLQIDQTDNSATNDVEFNAPVISEREATTQIFIRDGQTTVIGGLSGNTKSHTVSGIPFLSRIPFIGGVLFGNTVHNDDATELFLFLTPHIISSNEDIDRLREGVRNGSELLQQVPIGTRIVPAGDTVYIGQPDSTRRRPPPDSMKLKPDSTRRRPPPPDSTKPKPDSTARPKRPPGDTLPVPTAPPLRSPVSVIARPRDTSG